MTPFQGPMGGQQIIHNNNLADKEHKKAYDDFGRGNLNF